MLKAATIFMKINEINYLWKLMKSINYENTTTYKNCSNISLSFFKHIYQGITGINCAV